MENKKYRALLVSEVEEKNFKRELVEMDLEGLEKNDVLIRVEYSSLNYKDALSASGNKGVTRNYPHTPGIDAAGVVVESNNPKIKVGDEVIVTGYDLGMNTFGGYGEYISIPSEWLVKLPENMTLRDSMVYGTAGLTAALSVYKLLKQGIAREDGEILVTGGTGGVGSIAIGILSKLGYDVVAGTRKLEEKEGLLRLGAKDIISIDEINDQSNKLLLRPRWTGVVDTVGGSVLETALKTTKYGGSLTACGNRLSHELNTTVFPFILRGINLLGVDSVEIGMDLRQEIWGLLAGEWKLDFDKLLISEVGLEGLDKKIGEILEGSHKGRTLVKVKA